MRMASPLLASALALLAASAGCGSSSPTPPPPPDDGTCTMQQAAVANEGWAHVPEGSAIAYVHNPPASGPHYPVWLRYEEFTSAQARGYWVHNLEHGAIVMLYRPDAGALIGRVFTWAPGDGVAPEWWGVLALLLGVHALSFWHYREDLLQRLGWPGRVALISATVLAIAALGAGGRPFIYFQF